MKKLAFLFALVFLSMHVSGQSAMSQVLMDVQVLSADSLEGRATDTKGSEKARKYLLSRFQEIGLHAFSGGFERPFKLKESGKAAVNLVGYTQGETDSCIVITAHYDHLGIKAGKVFNGADDNASGVAGLLAIANSFKQAKPKHTLVFAVLDTEEVGLKGAEALLSDSSFNVALIRLNINMDMISHNDENQLYAVGTYHYPRLMPILNASKTKSTIDLLMGHDKPKDKLEDWTYSSDHYPFHKRKIPFLYFGVEDHKDYHSDSDTFENINQSFLTDVVKLLTAVVAEADKNF